MKRQWIIDPIEFLDLHSRLPTVASAITTRVINGDYVPHSPSRILIEKSRGLCRQVVVPHPYDCLVLQCLSTALHAHLKRKAPHPNAFYQPERALSSKKRDSYGGMAAWLNFQREILAFSKRRKIVVITDIANFYDFINHSHLRNIISNHLPDEHETILDLTLHILNAMLWQPDYMQNIGIGLPQIDLDAPRLLAHTFLFELDKFLSTTAGIDYARFMDDIDIGVDTIAAAKQMLRDVDLILQSRHIRLNSGKTQILVGKSVDSHFKTRENYLIDTLVERIKQTPTNLARHRQSVLRLLAGGLRRRVFDSGNGDKILKRLINLAARIDCPIPNGTIRDILKLRPTVREQTFNYVRTVSNAPTYVPVLLEFINSPEIVDDGCALMFAYCLVEMRMTKALRERKAISAFALRMPNKKQTEIWTYAALWLLSKYGTQRQIIDLVADSYVIWRSDYALARLVSALAPIITTSKARFEGFLNNSRNSGAVEVRAFYGDIDADQRTQQSISSFLRASNPSFPNRITHAKWLVLMQVLKSPITPQVAKQRLQQAHSFALSDHYYKIRSRHFK